MNNNHIDNIIHSLSSVRMTEVEKKAMRSTLLDLTYTTSVAIPSPYVFRFSHLRKSLSLALVIFLVVGSISKPASASALPGEFLYSVKMMHEEIEGITKTTSQEKVDFEISRTQKRIAEATVLVETKSLNSEQETAIAERIKKHTDKARDEIQEVRSKDAVKALELNLELETSLRSNAQQLRKVMDESENSVLTLLEEEVTNENTTNTQEPELALATTISSEGETKEVDTESTVTLTEVNELDIALDTQVMLTKETVEASEENTRLLVTSIEDDIKEIEEVTRQAKVEVASKIVAPQALSVQVTEDLLLKR